jgi:predicted membrane-bound mannosyltransferase
MFWLLGDGDVTGRLIPSLLGTLIVALVYPLYRMGYLDKKQTLLAALFLALSGTRSAQAVTSTLSKILLF